MKAGILTFHSAHNYGAALQCYALQEHLRALGIDIAVIDYHPKETEKQYALNIGNIRGIRSFLRYAPTLPIKLFRQRAFNRWCQNHLQLAAVDDRMYDTIVYGSDQIWSRDILRDDLTYWGVHELNAKKHITYSASAGDVDKLHEIGECTIRERLKKFSAISVRETSLQQFLQPLTQHTVYCTLDPIFLLSTKQWNCLVGSPPKAKKHILVYNLWDDPAIARMAETLSSHTGYPIVELCAFIRRDDYRHSRRRPCENPTAFVQLIRDAYFVLTSSFHGTAFSVLFNKPFIVYQTTNSGRVRTLLKKLGMEERFTNQLSERCIEQLDYSQANQRLARLIAESKAYLSDNLLP